MKKALVVVDMQNDFVNGALGSQEAIAIVPFVVGKVVEAINAGTTVIFTQDTHSDEYLATKEGSLLPVPHCVKDTSGWEIIPQLQEYVPGRKVFEKGTFGSIDLMEYLKEENFAQMEFIGLCTDICVISNVMLAKAALPEAEIQVDSTCCAGVTPQSHNNALAAMKMCHITIQ